MSRGLSADERFALKITPHLTSMFLAAADRPWWRRGDGRIDGVISHCNGCGSNTAFAHRLIGVSTCEYAALDAALDVLIAVVQEPE